MKDSYHKDIQNQHPKLIEYFAAFFIVLVFSLAVGKYYYPHISEAFSTRDFSFSFFQKTAAREQKISVAHNLLLRHNKSTEDWEIVDERQIPSDDFVISEGAKQNIVLQKSGLNSNRVSSLAVRIGGVHTYFSDFEKKIETEIPFDDKQKSFKSFEQEDVIPIMGYHFIVPDGEKIVHPSLEMTQSDFRAQIKFMTEEVGCRWFTFDQIMNDYVLQDKKKPRDACVINFDDGRDNNFTLAFPVLEEFEAKATFFIITDRIGTESYMSWKQVDRLYQSGHEIGSHSYNSGSLADDTLIGGDAKAEKELNFQLEKSLEMLRERGYGTTTFAYPRGQWNDVVVQAVKNTGYTAARDIRKRETWRDKRTSTVGFSKNLIWHMHYIKPEGMSENALRQTFSYDGWWQIEEGLKDQGSENSKGLVNFLSSANPTARSYAVVSMEEGAEVSNKFAVSGSGKFNIEFLAALSKIRDREKINLAESVEVLIDGERQIHSRVFEEACIDNGIWHYCTYGVEAELTKGEHTITLKAPRNKILLDKFRVFRKLNVEKQYPLKIVEILDSK